jgi:ADP-heptose:LPS heptosyltransferase
LAERLLACCLAGERWPSGLLGRLTTPECSDSLFRVVVERLADLFEPRLSETYAQLFSEVIAHAIPELDPASLVARYRRVRYPRAVSANPETVFVLSRVTLGADVAITSVLLDAAKRRFPRARIVLVGSRKSWELFAADPRIEHASISYRRSGSVADRLALWPDLQRLFSQPDSLVVDPDSRLTQLGLLPVCPEENYCFFESRAFAPESEDPLPLLAAQWAHGTFGMEGAAPWIAPQPSDPIQLPPRPLITMSLGVGENSAKRVADPFEQQLVALAAGRAHVLIDEGAGGEEAERVTRAISGTAPGRVHAFRGSFAAFAAAVAQSDLYIGYDSAGQHVAAACGVPLLSVFAGFPSPRFVSRWRPCGKGRVDIVKVQPGELPRAVFERAAASVERLLS